MPHPDNKPWRFRVDYLAHLVDGETTAGHTSITVEARTLIDAQDALPEAITAAAVRVHGSALAWAEAILVDLVRNGGAVSREVS